jgi:outer membrane protein OmpA-like peptidoglycan-associated protein
VITDAASGAPVAALVTARGSSTRTASSDPVTGKYEITLEPGSWEVNVAGRGYAARTETVQVTERAQRAHDWTLPAVPPQMALEGVGFEMGTATIKRESFTALDAAARFLMDNPTVAVVIEGHTDEASTPAENVSLSQRRADAVLKYLVVNHGVNPSRLDARGIGADRPLAPSDSQDAGAKNRRIELVVTPASSN